MSGFPDLRKALIQSARWYILVALNLARPDPVPEALVLCALDDSSLKLTEHELRRELDYLADRGLIDLTRGDAVWTASLTAAGVDLVEYTTECRPGINRPPKRA